MSDQGKQLSSNELRQRAETQRSSVRQTAEALQERLKAKSESVQHAVSDVRGRARRADGFVRDHHWAFIGAATVLGAAFGIRGGRRRRRVREQRYLRSPGYSREAAHDVAEETGKEVTRKGAVGAFAGMMLGRLGSALAREGAGLLLARYEQWRHDQAMEEAMSAENNPFMGGEPVEPDEFPGTAPYPEHLRYPGR